MLKSVCIKTNNNKVINYLLNKLEDININNVYISKLKFSKFTNIIIHYTGKNEKLFLTKVSEIISIAIIDNYEEIVLKKMLSNNYFYFTNSEQNRILETCIESLNSSKSEDKSQNINQRKKLILNSLLEYFKYNKSLILIGFINFRLDSYLRILDSILDNSVNKFVIDREYIEFINLLKTYINSKDYGLNLVHLVYKNQESILLDEFKDTIFLENTALDTKYISDISFSSNDYALNNLLTLLPKKIYVHLINCNEDEFINTLKLIFGNRICICKDCDICKLYSLEKINK